LLLLSPKPKQGGVTANQQISKNNFHGGVSSLGRNMQRIRKIAQARAGFVITNPQKTETIDQKARCEPRYKTGL
jgi:hypothetical protein